MNSVKNTPMMKQYLSIKCRYPDAVLLYRMGDFYEMFFDDAEIASRVLEIVLTSRNKNNVESVPMCGFPYRSAHSYIAKLISNGYKVAICDQIGNSTKGGLVERKVVRIITPGMVVDDDLLNGKINNFILALGYYKKTFGIAFLDISTGDFFVTESQCDSDVMDEIIRISPSEILISEAFKEKFISTIFEKKFASIHVSLTRGDFFDYDMSYQVLLDQFGTLSLEGFGCGKMHAGIVAAGALIRYVHETQNQRLQHLKFIKAYFLDSFLIVDTQSCKNLELFDGIRSESKNEALISILDNTVTLMGARLLNKWMRYPSIDRDQILQRYDAISEAINNTEIRDNIRQTLESIFDLERLVGKVAVGSSNARHLSVLKKSIQAIPKLFESLSNFVSDLYYFAGDLESLYGLANLIHKSIREDAPISVSDGGIIKEGFIEELDELIEITRSAKSRIINLESKEKESTKINSLKVRYNKVLGYYIEIPKTQSKAVPKHYVCKQTLVSAGRYTTDALKQYESKILNAENQRSFLELEIFGNILIEVKKHNRDIQMMADFIAIVDCLTNLALVAHKNNYCRPRLNSKGIIDIEAGRHPVVEKSIDGERFVPNSIKMDNEQNQIIIITGPNMAGKSTVLRQAALCVVMAQMGSFVPADKANITISDRIFTRVGALDNLAAGQSTFMVEMQETANILNNATGDSLVIIDEIGRGTSTFDGLSIAWAIAEYLHDLNNCGVKSMFATHYHELTELEKYKLKVKNFNVTAKEIAGKVIFMRKLVKGSTKKSYGIQVACLAGMPKCVVERASEILFQLGRKNNNVKTITKAAAIKTKPGKSELISNIPEEYEDIISMLKSADILKMNPIEALNYLNKLKIKAKAIDRNL